jgi:hypothetical protein
MTITKSTLGKVSVTLLAVMFMVFSISATVLAQGQGQGQNNNQNGSNGVKKIQICHANTSNPNSEKPYTINDVSVNALNGHDGHIGDEGAGVVWNETIHNAYKTNGTKWGDIIPPTVIPGGMNWDKYGQAVYLNDCNYVEAVVANPVTFVNPTCDAKGTYTVPATKGVVYYLGDKVVAAGTYTVESDMTISVTAKAAKGYVLSEESKSEWSNKFVTPTNCDVAIVTPPASTPGTVAGASTTATPQVAVTPVGAADAGGAGTTALVGLVGSTLAVSLGAVIRKFSL